MKKQFKIEVDCANCAREIEEAAGKVPGVASVSVSFLTQKMEVEFSEGSNPDAVMKQVKKTCCRIEPDFTIEL